MLLQKFNEALSGSADVAQNSYLMHLRPAVEQVEASLTKIPGLKFYEQTLLRLLDEKYFPLKPKLTNFFAQTLGEAHFWAMCEKKGVPLRRVPELAGKKTPDFEASYGSAAAACFEVKTLSVVSGEYGIDECLHSSVEANVEIEAKLKRGDKVAMAESEARPYGKRPSEEGALTAVINTLIEKAEQNIKQDQFANRPTFLVLNLSVIPPMVTKPVALRPSYPDDYLFDKAVTGEMWAMAFGRIGMPIQVNPEFEGKPCVEAILDKVGILESEEFKCVAGILFMVHPWNEPSQIWGLYRRSDWTTWEDVDPDLIKLLFDITGDVNWNDDGDCNGWRIAQSVYMDEP